MENFKYRRAIYIIPWISLPVGWLLGTLSGERSEVLGAWLLLFSALAFGLPHGAYDFWILFDSARSDHKPLRRIIGLLSAYLLLAVSVIAVWYFLPGSVLIGFLALTAWHFGSGDAIWENTNRFELIVNSVTRGLIVMSAPLAFYPVESGYVLSRLDAFASEKLIFIAPYTLGAGIFLLFLNAFSGLFRNTQKSIDAKFLMWLETMFLLVFFKFTTPLLAVTVYLIGVHSWRHLLRLEVYEQKQKLYQPKPLFEVIRRFHVRALPITVISLLGLVAIYYILNLRISELTNYTSAYLVLLSALTLPHAILISYSEFNRRRTNPI